jgi:arylsulfatase A-like enzyme
MMTTQRKTSIASWGYAMLVAFAVMTLSACSRPPQADNILFVSFDTTRADHISAYGYDQATTPNIDRLASEGVLFERAFSHVPSTLPAHTSMFTGLLPPEHSVRCNGWLRVPAEHETLAETLGARGFKTGAVIGAFPLDNRFGLDQGFASYDARFSSGAETVAKPVREERAAPPTEATDTSQQWLTHDYVEFERSAAEVTDRSIAWLEEQVGDGDDRWFLFAHYFDPHWPYQPPPEWAALFELPYDAELAYADYHLGRLLDFVDGLPGRTLVVFTADHGEGLGDHGEDLHNRFLYNSTLHVPLIIRLEGSVDKGERVLTNVSHIDIRPTLLELLGVTRARETSGVSLVPALTGGSVAGRDIYAETLVWALEMPQGISVRSLIRGNQKWVRTDTELPAVPGRRDELYNMGADPSEINDLALLPLSAKQRKLRTRLDRWSSRLESEAGDPEHMPLDESTRVKLKALGYLGD